jgi:hypothetical protein
MLLPFAAGAHGPQSPVDATKNAVMIKATPMFQE